VRGSKDPEHASDIAFRRRQARRASQYKTQTLLFSASTAKNTSASTTTTLP